MMRDVFARLWDSTILFAAVADGAAHDRTAGEPAGMGTLVLADGPCILTASHVWDLVRGAHDRLPGSKEKDKEFFAIRWQSERKGRLLGTSDVIPRAWPMPVKGWSDLGPDVALIGLSAVDEADLKDRGKIFFDLDRARDSNYTSTVWMLIGAPAEEITLDVDAQLTRTHLYPSPEVRGFEHDGFDYVDVPGHYGKDGRPRSYEGVSGGGLWRIGRARSADGVEAFDGRVWFEGVAFWQKPEADVVRCHGRKTIEQTRGLKPSRHPLLLPDPQ